jgi:hypothetical protein
VDDLGVIDSFQFFGSNMTPASVSFRIEWQASGPFAPRGRGTEVPPTEPAAFLGEFATAVSSGFFEGEEFGFAFEASGSSDPRGYAQMGRERNGVFLS